MESKHEEVLASIKTKDGNLVELVRLKEKYFEGAIEMMAQTQTKSHPWFINAGVDYETWKKFLKCFFTYEDSLSEGNHHVIALMNGKVVGFAGMKDQSSRYPSYPQINLGDTFINQGLSYTKPSQLSNILKDKSALLLFWVVVDDAYSGNGIGKLLFTSYKYLPELSNYKYLYTDPASAASHNICKQLGFTFLRTTKYEEFYTPQGIKPFLGIHKKLEAAGLALNNDEFSNCILEINS